MTLVDTCVWLDVLKEGSTWGEWSQIQMDRAIERGGIVTNAVVYAELSIGFESTAEVDRALRDVAAHFENLPREALFLAGKAFRQYRRRRGTRTGVLPDFFIGAHAAVRELPLLTRDPTRFRGYFPTVALLTPETV